MLLRNTVFAIETGRRLLEKLAALARYRKDSKDPNRGISLFSANNREDQYASADFLRLLLQCLQVWGKLYLSETDSTLASFYSTYQKLVIEGVTFPAEIEMQRASFDIDQFKGDVSKLERVTASGQYGGSADSLAADIKRKLEELQQIIGSMKGRASETTVRRYSDIQQTAISTLERYSGLRNSASFFSSPPKDSPVLEWDAEPFPDEPLPPSKPLIKAEFGFDDIDDDFEAKTIPKGKKSSDFDFEPKWESGDFFTKEFATAPVQFAAPIVAGNEGKKASVDRELEEIVNQQVAKIAGQTTSIAVLQGEVQKLNQIIREKDSGIQQKEAEIADLQSEIAKKRAEIEGLNERIAAFTMQLKANEDSSTAKMVKMSQFHQTEKQLLQDQMSKQAYEVEFT